MKENGTADGKLGRRLVLGLPYAWLLLFFLAPFAIVLAISLSEARVGIPPYLPLVEWSGASWPKINAKLDNYLFLGGDALYLNALLGSLRIAATSAIICLLVGYPMALALARSPMRWRAPLLIAVIVPLWTSFLIRVYAWMGLLKTEGPINAFLESVGLISAPLPLLHTTFAVHVGIVYSYLPFMVLPLYAALERQDPALLEAAHDLGARPLRAFLTVTLPLSLPGVFAGLLLVFIPAVGEFVIPDLLGGPETLMLGKVLWIEFFNNRDWPLAASVAVAMLVLLVAPLAWLENLRVKRGEGQR